MMMNKQHRHRCKRLPSSSLLLLLLLLGLPNIHNNNNRICISLGVGVVEGFESRIASKSQFLTTASSLLHRHATEIKQEVIYIHGKGEYFRLFNAPPSLYQEQERLLVDRGVVESGLMKNTGSPISASVCKGTGAVKGFGAASGMKPVEIKAAAKVHAKELRKSGVVRIDDILTGNKADELREYVFGLRKQSEEQVRSGKVRQIECFADVLLKENRCDLTIPLEEDVVIQALLHVLQKTPVGKMISSMLGKEAVLYELSCLISDKGCSRQVVHPDTPCTSDGNVVLYTCFIALQDIDLTMGPTTWIPKTHTASAHDLFKDDFVTPSTGESSKDKLLRTTPSVLGVLPKGSCVIFDSRLLHCGGANTSHRRRALFYFSFKDSKIGYPGNPGSIRPELSSKYTITTLEKELNAVRKSR